MIVKMFVNLLELSQCDLVLLLIYCCIIHKNEDFRFYLQKLDINRFIVGFKFCLDKKLLLSLKKSLKGTVNVIICDPLFK